ncbi:MAG: peptidoglycan DD-metalloendopeptidase family protein [Rhodospirillales bacterium]
MGTATRRQKKSFWRERSRDILHRLFPERQLLLRTGGRASFIRFSRRTQIMLVAVLVLAGTWSAFTSVSYVLHHQVLALKDSQITRGRLAYRSLLDEVSEYQKKFASITLDLEENHALMLNLVVRNAALQQNLRSVEVQLTKTEDEREQVIAVRENLNGQLREIEDRMSALASRNFALKDNLGAVEGDLQTALVERNRALFEGNRMRRHIKDLEARLGDLQEAELRSVQNLTDRAVAYIDSMERVVALAGLAVDQLLKADGGLPKGQGGPFIEAEAEPDALPADRLKANLTTLDARLQQSKALESVMRKLPLTAPLNSYYITSSFGKRRDPVNKRWASHYGLDMGGTLKSPVYVTAPGVVTSVGWNGKYGKMIEIDHGAGIKTRYGHLHKTLVKKGQKVKYRQKIGLLGNTGRSTGAHLHYEVLFKRKAKDPMKFIQAGRYVFQE